VQRMIKHNLLMIVSATYNQAQFADDRECNV